MKERFRVGGYAFETKAEWEAAKREEESIGYIRVKTNLSDSAAILKLYSGLVEKKTFITPIGIDFLKELKRNIILAGAATEDTLPGIPAKVSAKKSKSVKEFSQEADDRQKMMTDYYKAKLKNTQIVAAVLVVVIAAMFAIAMLGPDSPLIDAEIQIKNKYASWEQDLSQREDKVMQQEQDFLQREDEIIQQEKELKQREDKIKQKEQELGITAQ